MSSCIQCDDNAPGCWDATLAGFDLPTLYTRRINCTGGGAVPACDPAAAAWEYTPAGSIDGTIRLQRYPLTGGGCIWIAYIPDVYTRTAITGAATDVMAPGETACVEISLGLTASGVYQISVTVLDSKVYCACDASQRDELCDNILFDDFFTLCTNGTVFNSPTLTDRLPDATIELEPVATCDGIPSSWVDGTGLFDCPPPPPSIGSSTGSGSGSDSSPDYSSGPSSSASCFDVYRQTAYFPCDGSSSGSTAFITHQYKAESSTTDHETVWTAIGPGLWTREVSVKCGDPAPPIDTTGLWYDCSTGSHSEPSGIGSSSYVSSVASSAASSVGSDSGGSLPSGSDTSLSGSGGSSSGGTGGSSGSTRGNSYKLKRCDNGNIIPGVAIQYINDDGTPIDGYPVDGVAGKVLRIGDACGVITRIETNGGSLLGDYYASCSECDTKHKYVKVLKCSDGSWTGWWMTVFDAVFTVAGRAFKIFAECMHCDSTQVTTPPSDPTTILPAASITDYYADCTACSAPCSCPDDLPDTLTLSFTFTRDGGGCYYAPVAMTATLTRGAGCNYSGSTAVIGVKYGPGPCPQPAGDTGINIPPTYNSAQEFGQFSIPFSLSLDTTTCMWILNSGASNKAGPEPQGGYPDFVYVMFPDAEHQLITGISIT